MQKQRRRVLVLCAWLRPAMGAGLARFAREANWHFHLGATITGASPRHVACNGVLVFHTERADLTALARKRAVSCPTVVISGMNPIVQAPVVREDNLAVGRMAAEHFLHRGFRQVAWLANDTLLCEFPDVPLSSYRIGQGRDRLPRGCDVAATYVRPTPEIEEAARKQAIGVVRVDPGTGKVETL